ncbi:MAG: hypothetical protein H6797_02780 [Candidatus Nomurabacteria bacterium]|nr:MAG: hypothetical protein H6797_02780 [Candidatus Nomurabacteria bacterium]
MSPVRESKFTVAQLELANWLVQQAVSPFSSNPFVSRTGIPKEIVEHSTASDADYTLAASIATTASAGHYVLYLPEYGHFFFQPKTTSFPVYKSPA